MKLFAGKAPNAFRVFAFMSEKNIDIPVEILDVMQGETRMTEHVNRNSLGEIPVLELDDGTYLSESIAICRYLESLYPNEPLMGQTPLEIAKIEMWNRRMENQIMGPHAQLGLHVIPVFADKIEQLPAYAETQRRLVEKNWAWLDSELADGRDYVAGNNFSVADITGMTALMIAGFMDVEVPSNLVNVNRWVTSVTSRDSWNQT